MKRLVPVAGVGGAVASLLLLALLVAPPAQSPGVSRSDADDDATGSAAPAQRPAPVVDEQARALLRRASTAPGATSYRGVQFVSAWTARGATSQVVEIEHHPVWGTTLRSRGGPADSEAAVSVPWGVPSASVATTTDAVGLLATHYSLAMAASSRVAGRLVDVVEARRPEVDPAAAASDAAVRQKAVAARFWLDRETGLVLRREVYDGAGHTVRASAFVELTVNPDPQADATAETAAGSTPRAWAASLDRKSLDRMRARGWTCPAELPGPLPLVDARRGGVEGRIVHLSYSDGLASVSVFQQPGRLDPAGVRGYRRDDVQGHQVWVLDDVPRRVVWAAYGQVWTVVADAPQRTVDRAVAALPHHSSEEGPMDRLGRGLDRVASWFDPFG